MEDRKVRHKGKPATRQMLVGKGMTRKRPQEEAGPSPV